MRLFVGGRAPTRLLCLGRHILFQDSLVPWYDTIIWKIRWEAWGSLDAFVLNIGSAAGYWVLFVGSKIIFYTNEVFLCRTAALVFSVLAHISFNSIQFNFRRMWVGIQWYWVVWLLLLCRACLVRLSNSFWVHAVAKFVTCGLTRASQVLFILVCESFTWIEERSIQT